MRKSIASVMITTFRVLVCIVLLTSGLVANVPAKPMYEKSSTSITYINTDWTISDTQVRENETIVLTGNLTVEFGGHLTLRNITLLMNSSAGGSTIAEFYHIEIKKGGTIYILDQDNDNTTTNDASNITINDSNAHYWFWVRDGSNFTMRNSELHECGGASVFLQGAGLMVYTDNATIDHNLISNNYYGIVLYGSDAVVSNNTVEWNGIGIECTAWSNATIENNLIEWSDTYGIKVDGVSNSKNWGSNPLIKGNTIYKTGRDGINQGDALQIETTSHPILIDNEVIDWGEDGIYTTYRCSIEAESLLLQPDGGNYCIVGGGGQNWVWLTNSTLYNSVGYDVLIGGTYVVFTNNSYNPADIGWFDSASNFTARWFLNTYVDDSFGNPVPGANIRIRDNANGTYDQNFTTDSSGYVNWTPLTEYFQNKSTIIDYSQYNITVEKNGYFPNYADIEMNESKYITITLLEQDTEKPEINHVPVASANISQTINITANITDDIGVNKVFLNYTDVHGANQNITMNKWGDNYSFDISGQNISGIVSYFIWANDTSDNDNCTIIFQTLVFDITDPSINHIPVISVNISESINITANVTDDVSVNSVYLNYTGINGTNYFVPMQEWNGNYSYELPGQETIGFVQYFIWANDSDGNNNRTIEYSLEILDIVDPEINQVSAASANIREPINITTNVTDNVEVDKVFLNYTDVTGNNYNISMNKNGSNWTYKIAGQDDIGYVDYFISCNDTSGNDNQTIVYKAQISDVSKPEIEHTPVTSVNISQTINITANITDDSQVYSVYLNYTDINGVEQNVSMAKWNGNWSYEIEGQDDIGTVLYFIWANDTSGNENQTEVYQVQINEVIIPDTTPPTILSKSPIGTNVSITTTITITFDEPMNMTSVQNAITISPAIQTSYGWNTDNTTVTITPSGNLSYNMTYNMTVGIGAKDIAGNGLENAYSWEVTTELETITNGSNDKVQGHWWIGIIILLVTIIMLLLLHQLNAEMSTK